MKWSADEVDEVFARALTVISTVPVPAGLVAVMEVPDGATLTMVAGFEPKSTEVPSVKPVPMIVTVVPPPVGPVVGLTEVTMGVGVRSLVVVVPGGATVSVKCWVAVPAVFLAVRVKVDVLALSSVPVSVGVPLMSSTRSAEGASVPILTWGVGMPLAITGNSKNL